MVSERLPIRAGSRYRRARNARLAALLCSTFVCSVAPPGARAADYDNAGLVQAGQGDRADHVVALGYSRGLTSLDPAGASPWSFHGEAVAGSWFVHNARDGDRKAFAQISLSPVVRYDLGRFMPRTFIEAGIGLAAILPRFRDHDRHFATTFNFDDHASLGFRFGARDANELSIRAEHFSNAGIRNPNPGQNFGQLRYARYF